MRALVTGATGMIGAAIVDALLARRIQVRALVRPTSDVDALLHREVDLIIGDLDNPESVRHALTDIDVVFHAAALIRADETELNRVNVAGTERMLAASRAAGIRRFVHISSVGVYGSHEPPVHEDTPQHPATPYARSKQAAEAAVWRAAQAGLEVVLLRPSLVYGPGDRYVIPTLVQVMRLPFLPLPEGGDFLIDLVYSTDVADAAVLAATRPRAAGHAYNVTDGRPTTVRDLVDTYGLLTGSAPRIVSLDSNRLARAADAIHAAIRPVAPQLAYLLQSSTVANLGRDMHYDITKAERELGYTPRVGLYDGLRQALAARDSRLLSRPRRPLNPVPVMGGLALAGLIGAVLVGRRLRGTSDADSTQATAATKD